MTLIENFLHIGMFTVTFVLTLILGPMFIPILRKLKFGQTVRDDGPQSHLIKTGTPTMGGIIFIIAVLVVGGIYSFYNPKILPLLFVVIGFGLIGFIDDFIKVVKKRKDGLYPGQKMIGLILVSAIFSFYIAGTGMSTEILIPFLNTSIDLAWFFVPFTIVVLLATSNSVNMTDGLDGLAAGVTLIVMVFFTVISMPGLGLGADHINIFSATVSGACLGFLAFNMYPAKLFMGDTGSLALGSAVGAVAIMMKLPLLLFIVGGIYMIETLSVIIQVGSFKLRGKRVFKMAPIHHHYELKGWKETKVVKVFWLTTLVLCIIGFISIKINIY